MPEMIEVVIDSVRVSLTNQQRIVVLKDTHSEQYLVIWIGPYEAEAITIALQEIEVARPQTHDLLKSILSALNARLTRVEVSSLSEDVFYGNLVIETDGKQVNIDSRPSDALALAVRFHVPIMVSKEVMESAGIQPEKDIQKTAHESTGESAAGQLEETPESKNRLSVFEDFLEKLDVDDLPDSKKNKDQPDEDQPKPKGKTK
jgi:hypothetical protein